MLRISVIVVAESVLFAMICMPIVLLIIHSSKLLQINVKNIVSLIALFSIIFLIVDVIGTYTLKSSFVGLFYMAEYIWFISLSYLVVSKLIGTAKDRFSSRQG